MGPTAVFCQELWPTSVLRSTEGSQLLSRPEIGPQPVSGRKYGPHLSSGPQGVHGCSVAGTGSTSALRPQKGPIAVFKLENRSTTTLKKKGFSTIDLLCSCKTWGVDGTSFI